MTQAVTYKGYTIQPAPRQRVDTGQWELNVFISWATEDEEDSRHFVKTDRYATGEEATVQCIGLPVGYSTGRTSMGAVVGALRIGKPICYSGRKGVTIKKQKQAARTKCS